MLTCQLILCNRSNFLDFDYPSAFGDGLNMLHAMPGLCRIDSGKGTCVRVYCQADSGVWFCNDVRKPFYAQAVAKADDIRQIIVNISTALILFTTSTTSI
jgi:hypothetical protein